jgi:hypothetical protein
MGRLKTEDSRCEQAEGAVENGKVAWRQIWRTDVVVPSLRKYFQNRLTKHNPA